MLENSVSTIASSIRWPLMMSGMGGQSGGVGGGGGIRSIARGRALTVAGDVRGGGQQDAKARKGRASSVAAAQRAARREHGELKPRCHRSRYAETCVFGWTPRRRVRTADRLQRMVRSADPTEPHRSRRTATCGTGPVRGGRTPAARRVDRRLPDRRLSSTPAPSPPAGPPSPATAARRSASDGLARTFSPTSTVGVGASPLFHRDPRGGVAVEVEVEEVERGVHRPEHGDGADRAGVAGLAVDLDRVEHGRSPSFAARPGGPSVEPIGGGGRGVEAGGRGRTPRRRSLLRRTGGRADDLFGRVSAPLSVVAWVCNPCVRVPTHVGRYAGRNGGGVSRSSISECAEVAAPVLIRAAYRPSCRRTGTHGLETHATGKRRRKPNFLLTPVGVRW